MTIQTLSSQQQLESARSLFKAQIVGVGEFGDYEEAIRLRVLDLLPRGTFGPVAPLWFGTVADSGEVTAAVHAAPPYEEINDLRDQGMSEVDLKLFARMHRTLGELAVHPTLRGSGLGARLLAHLEDAARKQGVQYLTGFADERTSSASFYSRNKYTMMGRNRPVPQLPPHNVVQRHYPGVNGNWFYKVL
jgi:GNAT superfamily N-acetyltransferase